MKGIIKVLFGIVVAACGFIRDPETALTAGGIGLILGIGYVIAPSANATAYYDSSGRWVDRKGRPISILFSILSGPLIFTFGYGCYAIVGWIFRY